MASVASKSSTRVSVLSLCVGVGVLGLSFASLAQNQIPTVRPNELQPAQPQPGGQPGQPQPRGAQPIPAHDPAQEVNLGDGLIIADMKPGRGAEVTANSFVVINYTAWVSGENSLVDTNRNRMPWGTPVPADNLLPGFAKAVIGMKVGGQRKMIIPPSMAYGEKGTKRVPPNSTLIWVVDVLDVVNPPAFDAAKATKTDSGALWQDVMAGGGDAFAEGSYAEAYLSLWDGSGKCIGSTRQAGRPQPVSSSDGRYWTEFLIGMKSGGQRVIELDNPQASADEKTKDRWRVLIEIRNVQAPIVMPVTDPSKEVTLDSGVKYADLVEGKEEMKKNHIPVVHYNGWLPDGTLVDSTHRPGRDVVFVSDEMMPRGFVEGIKGMKIGGKRKLVVPAALAYGDKGAPGLGVPAGSPVIWEVELVRQEEPLFLPVEEGEGTFAPLGGGPEEKKDK